MALLFILAATKHLDNIFKSGGLKEKSVSSKMEHTAEDGKIYKTAFYSLDAIISVGYRVNSKHGSSLLQIDYPPTNMILVGEK